MEITPEQLLAKHDELFPDELRSIKGHAANLARPDRTVEQIMEASQIDRLRTFGNWLDRFNVQPEEVASLDKKTWGGKLTHAWRSFTGVGRYAKTKRDFLKALKA
jgi:hypothetical protein